MDAERAFEVALDHYHKGNNLLNFEETVNVDDQGLHLARASAHFGAGNLAMALARAQESGLGQPAAPE
jgi:hypothetical protein